MLTALRLPRSETDVSPEGTDRPRAEAAIRKFYRLSEVFGGDTPEIVWVASPLAATQYLMDTFKETHQNILNAVSLTGESAPEWDYYASLAAKGVEYGDHLSQTLKATQELTASCGWVWMYHEICVVTERHTALHLDDSNPRRLHCEDGPAIRFPDGWASYCIHGVNVPEYVIMAPETITEGQIFDEKNDEVKRIMRERMER